MALARLCRYEEAHHALTEALKRQIYFVQGWLVLGLTLRQLHQYEEAIEAFNKALAIEPDQALAFFQQACCYAALDRQDWAIEHLRRAIQAQGRATLREAALRRVLFPQGGDTP
jgi:tetratricopeptide (TPR) repeat protein